MEFVYKDRKEAEAKLKQMDQDVASIVAILNEEVGKTWKEATRKNSNSKFDLDNRASAAMLPWDAMVRSMVKGSGGSDEPLYEFIERHVKNLAPWHTWKA